MLFILGACSVSLIHVFSVFMMRRAPIFEASAWLHRWYWTHACKYALTGVIFWVILTRIPSQKAKVIYLFSFVLVYVLSLPSLAAYWRKKQACQLS